ncbi:hypothetical protein AB0903_28400 [Streptomyces sp. NPDC048389]|uniref:hypothetical protein n=1 Tax=Streptomyces sp. NPDC048389 TaxID=3154622 RepID=UPI003452A53A
MTDRTAAGSTAAQADARALLDALPDTLPRDEILAINSSKSDVHTHRTYEYNGWTFDLPAGVFKPGDTSVSNTAELRNIVGYAVEAGFRPEITHRQTWEGDNCQAYLFTLRHDHAA